MGLEAELAKRAADILLAIEEARALCIDVPGAADVLARFNDAADRVGEAEVLARDATRSLGEMVAPESYLCVASGVRFYLHDPQPDLVRVTDIAHALANVNRFTGHPRRPYSVAEHSLNVRDLAVWLWRCEINGHGGADEPAPYDDRVGAYALLHDAHEAYIGDIIRPVKKLIRGVDVLADRVQAAIHARFGLDIVPPSDIADVVEYADNAMLVIETRILFDFSYELFWDGGIAPHFPPHVMDRELPTRTFPRLEMLEALNAILPKESA
jgi:hypothetical protein